MILSHEMAGFDRRKANSAKENVDTDHENQTELMKKIPKVSKSVAVEGETGRLMDSVDIAMLIELDESNRWLLLGSFPHDKKKNRSKNPRDR